MEPFVVTANVTIVAGEERFELVAGDVIDEASLPPGKWKSLRNTRGVVPQSEYERMFSPAVRGVEPPAPIVEDDEAAVEEEAGEVPEWQKTPMANLGLRPEAVVAFQGAGILTVRDALVYGQEHNGLATIRGIGKSTESATVEAIQKLMPKAEGDQTIN